MSRAVKILYLHVASDWIGIRFKNYREIFPKPLDYKIISEKLWEQRCPAGIKVICIIYSRRTAVRIAPFHNEKITAEYIYKHFPYGDKFNDSTHMFSFEIFKSTAVFMAALPLTVLNDACSICENLQLKIANIKQVDIIERRLLTEYADGINTRWICFPLDGGLRILSLSGGLPRDSYFISNDPLYREAELSALTLPGGAVIFNECEWLRIILRETHVEIIEEGSIVETV